MCTSTPEPSARSRASLAPRANSAAATISETTALAPRRRAIRRMCRSVTPESGASRAGGAAPGRRLRRALK
ncbi:hypothetical protein MET9862_03445 [Methylobacterium symbioticum]|uniref:Uncharacterized protein n=1 Tax=Methylobacterium symbioticum TaxID=2584084 RepID=A0A509EFA1_9HYPH|nr:hypothetical protein MET9862_03445 [Methylobacterium symbioticum]